MMTAGDLRHLIKIEQASNASDDHGDALETWTNWPTDTDGRRYAKIETRGGSERSLGGALEFVAGFTVTMWYVKGLTAGMRITHNDRVMNITSVQNVDERGVWMIAECEEVAT